MIQYGGQTLSGILELREASKVFGGGILDTREQTVAVDRVTFTVEEDDPKIVAVAGESGSGKTTLARLLLGSMEPSSGSMLYRGTDVRKLSRNERRMYRREVQPIFQDPFESYNPFYKVDHVLHLPIKNFKLVSSKAERNELVERALEKVGLQPGETLGRFPHQLSGGQRQRVMVARALLLEPRVILADEPVSMVDASLRATILDNIQLLNRDLGISVLYITHDLATAFQISDEILIMYRGNVVEYGDVTKVIPNPQHEYTRLLIDSIPHPDPSRRWKESIETTGTELVGTGEEQERFGITPQAERHYDEVEPQHWVMISRNGIRPELETGGRAAEHGIKDPSHSPQT